MIITIDGPTGSGKSSASRGIAEKLNYYCLSSGRIYRALAYVLINHFGYTKETIDKPKIQDLQAALDSKKFDYQLAKDGCGTIFYDGKDITPFLKSDLISQGASIVSTNKEVRELLSALQRTLAEGINFILEGRDSGSVVFDNADVKFYLTAELGIRTKRWQEVQKKRGDTITFQEAKAHINERDKRDQEREISPLIIPKDAIIIDNSYLDQQQTVDKMLSYILK